eukprot:1172483-Prorocentrum_minimum.AAC.2
MRLAYARPSLVALSATTIAAWLSLLIVDEDTINMHASTKLLRGYGYEVTCSANSQAALDLLQRASCCFHLVRCLYLAAIMLFCTFTTELICLTLVIQLAVVLSRVSSLDHFSVTASLSHSLYTLKRVIASPAAADVLLTNELSKNLPMIRKSTL